MVLTDEKNYQDIAAAIREKNGTEETYKPAEMAAAIAAIETGGGELPEEAYLITGDCYYRFSNNGWNWFIDTFGNKIKAENITSINYMFNGANKLEYIPFSINCERNSIVPAKGVFNNCNALKELPRIYNLAVKNESTALGEFFRYCFSLREIPEDYFDTFNFNTIKNSNSKSYYLFNGYLFDSCYSLRKAPVSVLNNENPITTYFSYKQCFNQCYSLDSIDNLPIVAKTVAKTSNTFGTAFTDCSRIKGFTFETDNGAPYVVSWKSQTIDLSLQVGYCYSQKERYILNYNSGITADKKVYDDTSYQALKNDNDWYATDYRYSRYNRISAVNTINSLPDTSAYLATAGGTNTIKFSGSAGALTDGGAINTMTEEEIAVATAKGWTVSFT